LLAEAGRFYIALNSSHYNRIIIKRLRHYLDKSAFMKRASRFVIYSRHFQGKIGFSKISKFHGL
ncbi:hypothetical protein T11_8119, partial [Trichinella zimbabwensis]